MDDSNRTLSKSSTNVLRRVKSLKLIRKDLGKRISNILKDLKQVVPPTRYEVVLKYKRSGNAEKIWKERCWISKARIDQLVCNKGSKSIQFMDKNKKPFFADIVECTPTGESAPFKKGCCPAEEREFIAMWEWQQSLKTLDI